MLSPIEALSVPYDREGLEDVGFMTCMALSLLGNYAQTGHFGGPLALDMRQQWREQHARIVRALNAQVDARAQNRTIRGSIAIAFEHIAQRKRAIRISGVPGSSRVVEFPRLHRAPVRARPEFSSSFS